MPDAKCSYLPYFDDDFGLNRAAFLLSDETPTAARACSPRLPHSCT
jgi:hypothetical protein